MSMLVNFLIFVYKVKNFLLEIKKLSTKKCDWFFANISVNTDLFEKFQKTYL